MAEVFSPQQVLDNYRQKFIDALHSSLEKHDRVSGGGLFQSVKAGVKVYGQKVVLEIRMEDYWKFVDEGVDGTKKSVGSQYKFKIGKPIPLSAVKMFIANRGIVPAMSISKHKKSLKIKGKGKLSSKLRKAVVDPKGQLDSMARAMGVNIKKHGIKPTHFATEVMHESNLLELFKKDLSIAVGRNIKIEIEKEIKQ